LTADRCDRRTAPTTRIRGFVVCAQMRPSMGHGRSLAASSSPNHATAIAQAEARGDVLDVARVAQRRRPGGGTPAPDAECLRPLWAGPRPPGLRSHILLLFSDLRHPAGGMLREKAFGWLLPHDRLCLRASRASRHRGLVVVSDWTTSEAPGFASR